jgi:hypothetical protein
MRLHAQSGYTGTAPTQSQTDTSRKLVVITPLRTFHNWENPRIHCTGGWKFWTAKKISPTPDLILGPPSPLSD